MLSGDDPSNAKMSGASEEELAAMLRWYVEMGVDLAVQDQPRDYFAEGRERAARAAEQPAAEAPSPAPPADAAPGRARIAPRLTAEPQPVRAASPLGAAPPEEALAQARQLAADAHSLEALKAALAGFEGCVLRRTASHLVFAEGAESARLMFIGDMPADQDDREARPFSGGAGALLDRMLAAVGLDRTKIHLANAVPWRPPGKRQPWPHEIEVCLVFLRRYIELARPSVIVTLGDLPARALLGAREPIVRSRGKWFDLALPDSQTVPAIAMFHPEYLVKAPAAKRHAWADLRAFRKALQERGLT